MTWLEEYAKLIDEGGVIVGYYIRQEIHNLIEELADDGYIYDTTEADKRIRFMETMCFQSKAPYYMKPMDLMPWQKAYIEALYSFKRKATGKRRFTESLVEIGRKNGKSTTAGGDANYDLFCGQSGSDICCASNDDRQAKIIWSEVGEMRGRLDPKKLITMQNLVTIKNKLRNISVIRMSSKTQNKDGFNFSKTYLDESHDIDEENGASQIAEACWRSMSSREEPLFINFTTQGFNRDCYLDRKLAYMKAVINREIDDDTVLPFLFEQDSEQEIWQDPASWEKSNPSLRYGVKKRDRLAADVERAKVDMAARVHCLTKDFNIPQNDSRAWLLLDKYDYEQEPIDMEQFRGAFYLGAVDLSATTDMTSVKALFMKSGDKRKYVLSHYFIPEGKLEHSPDTEAGAEYRSWARQGYITICEGNEVDIAAVAAWYFQLWKDYKMKPYKIGYDQRFAKDFLDQCDVYGFDTEMILQGKYLSSAMKLTEADLTSRVLQFGGNPVDKWCLRNVCCAVDNVENIQPVKVKGQPAMRIDGAVTMIMAEEVLRRHRSEYITIIDKAGG